MAWIGKLIGGAVGFAIGGPLGAIAGASLGNKFDKAKSTYELIKSERPYYYGNPIDQISRQEQLQYIFFTSIFTLLGKIANADGSISQQEINVLEDFLNRDLCLDESAKKFAKKLFFESANSNTDFKNIASQFYENFKNEKELLLTMIELLINLAMADGKLHPDEEKLILLTKQIFNIIDNDYQQILAKYIENFDRYYLILGCSKNDSNTTIQKNFRKLANEYHPDKIIAKGLPEEFIKFANQKFQEINEAYNKIMKKRNFQSEKNDPNHDDDDDEFKSDQKVKSNYNKFINVHDDAINNNYSFDYNKLKKNSVSKKLNEESYEIKKIFFRLFNLQNINNKKIDLKYEIINASQIQEMRSILNKISTKKKEITDRELIQILKNICKTNIGLNDHQLHEMIKILIG